MFQPINILFDVMVVGGSVTQNLSVDTGQYEPDHRLTPVALAPSLYVIDPDVPENSGEKKGKMTNVSWEINGASNTGTWQVGRDYYVNSANTLVVLANLKPDTYATIKLTANYYDNVRGRVNSLKWEGRLYCKSVVTRKFDLRCSESGLNRIDVFKNLTEYTLNAQLSNNGSDVDDSIVSYKWEVLVGSAFEAINTSRDLWCKGSPISKTLIVDPRYIGDVCVRCTAYQNNFPSERFYKTCRLIRWYGQYEDTWLWEAGQLKFIDTAYAQGRVVINRKKEGEVSSPERYFDIEVFYDNDNGMGWQHVAHGPRGRVERNMFPVDATHRDRFGWSVREKTELQALTVNGEPVAIDGVIGVLSVPKINRDV